MTIVIVDDHAPFRGFVRRLLDAKGFSVLGDFPDGESAVRHVKQLEPDAVLLDVQLGEGIDGFEVARQLHLLEHPPKVVMISSRDASAYDSELSAAPVVGFLTKQQFTVEALNTLLAETA